MKVVTISEMPGILLEELRSRDCITQCFGPNHIYSHIGCLFSLLIFLMRTRLLGSDQQPKHVSANRFTG